LLFVSEKKVIDVLFLTKKRLGYIFGDFFSQIHRITFAKQQQTTTNYFWRENAAHVFLSQ
jgi:hypothetical protein